MLYGVKILSRYEKTVIIEWRELYIKVGGMAKENMDGRRQMTGDRRQKTEDGRVKTAVPTARCLEQT
jgi:hypothetical protein